MAKLLPLGATLLAFACSGSDGPTRPPTKQTITFTFCAGNAPIWVAVQDGLSGAWTHVMPSAGQPNRYLATFAQDRGAIAGVFSAEDGSKFISVEYLSVGQLALAHALASDQCATPPQVTVTGSVTGLGADDQAVVGLDYDSAVRTGPGDYSITGIAAQRTLVARRVPLSSGSMDRLVVRRAVDIHDGAVIPSIDFESAEAAAPATVDVTIHGATVDSTYLIADVPRPTGESGVTLSQSLQGIGEGTHVSYPSLADAQLGSGALEDLTASVRDATNTHFRDVVLYVGSTAARSMTVAPAQEDPVITRIASTPYVRERSTMPAHAEYGWYVTLEMQQATRGTEVFATPEYFGGMPSSWDLTDPDLSGVEGFDPSWGPQDGVPADHFVSEAGGPGTAWAPAYQDGAEFHFINSTIPAASGSERNAARESALSSLRHRRSMWLVQH